MSVENIIVGTNRENIKSGVIDTLIAYKQLGEKFDNPPEVKLVIVPQVLGTSEKIGVRDIAITTAMQCYAAGDSKLKPRPEEKQQAIADSTAKAGHHTTRMHSNFTFHLKVSRDLAERILHFTPFYNSEQQSQRYVEAKEGSYEVPANLTTEQKELYVTSAEYMNRMYFELLSDLHPEVERRVIDMYPGAGWNVEKTAKRLNSKMDKICQEVARYVLPIAQRTTMYHSINELQLLRLFRGSQMENFTDEGRYIVASMIEEVAKNDPSILLELDKPLSTHARPNIIEQRVFQKQEFDKVLGSNNSLLLGITENPRHALAVAVRNVIGVSEKMVDDEESLKYLMDPKLNPLLSDVYEMGMFDPFTACLRQISFTFSTKLSHTAESQRQRHRGTPGATPTVNNQYDGTADYMTPLVIRENPILTEKFDWVMENIYGNVEKCLEAGIPKEVALKLLPNAHTIRTVETGDLFDWLHRFKQRLCYLAQEEICFISIEQVRQLLNFIPEAEKMFQAPCGVAHEANTGKCPEGDRWCGKPVWKWKIDKYMKERLI